MEPFSTYHQRHQVESDLYYQLVVTLGGGGGHGLQLAVCRSITLYMWLVVLLRVRLFFILILFDSVTKYIRVS